MTKKNKEMEALYEKLESKINVDPEIREKLKKINAGEKIKYHVGVLSYDCEKVSRPASMVRCIKVRNLTQVLYEKGFIELVQTKTSYSENKHENFDNCYNYYAIGLHNRTKTKIIFEGMPSKQHVEANPHTVDDRAQKKIRAFWKEKGFTVKIKSIGGHVRTDLINGLPMGNHD